MEHRKAEWNIGKPNGTPESRMEHRKAEWNIGKPNGTSESRMEHRKAEWNIGKPNGIPGSRSACQRAERTSGSWPINLPTSRVGHQPNEVVWPKVVGPGTPSNGPLGLIGEENNAPVNRTASVTWKGWQQANKNRGNPPVKVLRANQVDKETGEGNLIAEEFKG